MRTLIVAKIEKVVEPIKIIGRIVGRCKESKVIEDINKERVEVESDILFTVQG